MPRAGVMHVRWPEGYFTDNYPSSVIPGYIDTVKGEPLTVKPVAVYSQFIEMCVLAYGSIYSWQPEIDLYQSSWPAVFAAIPVLYTISECLLERLIESLPESLHDSLLESRFESMLESLLKRASHRKE